MDRMILTILLVFVTLQVSYGIRCGTCHKAEHINKCETVIECSSKECSLLMTDHGSHQEYTAGCGTESTCTASDATRFVAKQSGVLSLLKRERPVHHTCSMCCATDMCNVHSPHCGTILTTTPYPTPSPDSVTKTTYATPPTDTQTTTTTAKATTFAVPNPETSVKTTYLIPQTVGATAASKQSQAGAKSSYDVPSPDTTVQTTKTALLRGARCDNCKGGICGLIPGNDPVVQCPVHTPFCMNVVKNNENGPREITKSCESKKTCDVKWWHESSDRRVCTDFVATSLYNFNFTCTYCCVDDFCNRDVVPRAATLFQGEK